MSRPFLSVVVPAYNEESRIRSCVVRLRDALPGLVPSWEILVVDDGSRDRTREIVAELAAADPRIKLLALPHRGKGEAVRRGLLDASGDWRFMADADLAMPLDNLPRFLDRIRDGRRVALVIGSREAAGANRVEEPWIRHFIGRVFNWFVRIFVVGGITDTQCGFKLLSAEAVHAVCPHLTTDGFAFDVEMLALARRAGLPIEEVGITWDGRQESRVSLRRGAAAFLDVIRIRWRLRRGHASDARTADQPIERIGALSARSWAYLLALSFAAAIGYDLLRMPIQVFDALEEMLAAQRSGSIAETFWSTVYNAAYLRPLRIVQINLIFDAAQGHYWLAYRGIHALTMACGLLLFTRALRVRTAADLCAAAFALTVVTGIHTFRSTVQEAFPINHFLEIAVMALVVLNLAQARPRLIVDGAALVTFVVASLTLESGLLVWVVAVAAWLVGLRGISARGLAAMTVLLGAYLYARFFVLSVGVPGLVERSSGFLFEMLDPPALEQRFEDRLAVFYAYNVVSSALSVLASEPQSGVFVTLRSWLNGNLPPRLVLSFMSSIITTMLIAAAAVTVIRRWRTSDATDRLVFVFAAVLAANATMSYAYTKDDIMSVSGVFYGLAAYAAIRLLIGRASQAPRVVAAGLTVVMLVLGAAWGVRSLGIHHVARTYAFKTRNDWASQPGLWKRSGRWPSDPESQRLILQLRNSALSMRVPNPHFEPTWVEDVWGD